MAHSQLAERTGAAPAANPHFLLEQIVADLHWASLQFGMFTMLATLAAEPGASQGLRAFRHLVHDDARIMRLALRYAERAGLSPAIAQKLDRIYADMARQYELAGKFVAVASLSAGQRDELGRHLPALRRTVQEAAGAVSAVEAIGRGILPDLYQRDSASIREFLGRAARGERAEIDGAGVVRPPRLEQRRHSPRIEKRIRCRVAYAGGEAEGVILDVSREGLGLQCEAPIAENEIVAILVGERRLDATVARRRGVQLGLILKRPLPPTDPLFTGG